MFIFSTATVRTVSYCTVQLFLVSCILHSAQCYDIYVRLMRYIWYIIYDTYSSITYSSATLYTYGTVRRVDTDVSYGIIWTVVHVVGGGGRVESTIYDDDMMIQGT